jgi:chromosome segregation ATPase
MSNNLTGKLDDSLEDKIDRLIGAVQSIDSRLVNLETKADQRRRDTQPIWEAVQAQLGEVRDSLQRQGEVLQHHGEMLQRHDEMLQRLSEDMTGLRTEVASLRADTEKGFRTFDRRMERQIGEFERLHAYQRDLEDRVDKIEKLSTP